MGYRYLYQIPSFDPRVRQRYGLVISFLPGSQSDRDLQLLARDKFVDKIDRRLFAHSHRETWWRIAMVIVNEIIRAVGGCVCRRIRTGKRSVAQ